MSKESITSNSPTQHAHSQAQSALAESTIFDLRDLRVEMVDQALLICGSVSSYYHKQLAQEIVRAVVEPLAVINSIEVRQAIRHHGSH